jgi:hypothetical protein
LTEDRGYENALLFQRKDSLEGETMSRRLGIVCAAVSLLAAVGCSTGWFFLSWPGSGGQRQVVAGSVSEVAEQLRVSLGKANVIVAVNTIDDGTIRLNGETKSGHRFALVLKQVRTSAGEKTHISVEWEKDADEVFWAGVLDLLVKPAPVAPTTADGINAGR